MRGLPYFASFLLLIFISISCQKDKSIPNFKLPKNEEINAVIKALINSDSLPLAAHHGYKEKPSFCEDLEKLKIEHIEKDFLKKIPKKQEGESELIELLIGLPDVPQEKFFFSKSDSLYIEFQGKNFNTFKLEQKDFDNVQIRSIKELRKDFKEVKYFNFYHATIPIISLDGKKAYVKYTLHCSGLCGYCYRVFLEKRNGKWIVARYNVDWVS